jgi:ligand-binding sensor domain-containing protein
LGERDVRNVEARGSIPLSSSNASLYGCSRIFRGDAFFLSDFCNKGKCRIVLYKSILGFGFKLKMLKKIFLLIVTGSSFIFSFDRFTNFSSTTRIQDFYSRGDTLWVASSGGLYIFEKSKAVGSLLSASSSFIPDPNISALCNDYKSNVWIGTKEGYIGRRDKDGTTILNNSFLTSGWRINAVASYKNYLLIGTSNGLSIFNISTLQVEKNATSFKPLSSSYVNTLKVYKNILYVGLDDGVAKMDLSNDKLKTVNLFDPTAWSTGTASVTPVRFFAVDSSSSIEPFKGPADYFRNRPIYSESAKLYWGDTLIDSLPSAIKVIKSFGNNECWIGTEWDYFYKWDGTRLTNYKIPGPAFTAVSNVFVDNTGTLWASPAITDAELEWWKAIHAFDGRNWKLYSWANISSMGTLGGNADPYAMTQTKDGRIWFGTSGGSVKCFVPEKNEWSVFWMFNTYNGRKSGQGRLIHSFNGQDREDFWAKCDAIAQDSSGYLWISSWKNSYGALIIYDPHFEPDTILTDPSVSHYRRLFPNTEEDITCISVDKDGNVITGNSDGKIRVLHYNGSPLTANIDTINEYSIGEKILDAVATNDGLTRIISQKGVYVYDPGYLTDPKKIDFQSVDEFGENITSIEAENNSIFWLGTSGNGIIRYESNSPKQEFTQSQGLISNNIKSISIDRKNGCLWAATDLGVSRLSIGYSIDSNIKRNIQAYPNPFSRNRDRQINFENVPAGGIVMIYALNGNLVAKAFEQRKSTNGSLFTWKPSSSLIPGTYFYRINAGGYSKAGKLLITP